MGTSRRVENQVSKPVSAILICAMPIQNPLLASEDCVQRDITDDGSGTILACLCTRDYCNADSSKLGGQSQDTIGRQPERRVTTTSAPERRITPRTPSQTFTRAPET